MCLCYAARHSASSHRHTLTTDQNYEHKPESIQLEGIYWTKLFLFTGTSLLKGTNMKLFGSFVSPLKKGIRQLKKVKKGEI